jgi:molecular chaperone DnaK (HSP70)
VTPRSAPRGRAAPEGPAGLTRFAVGIDLGTTNSAVAVAPLDPGAALRPEVLAVPQLVAPATVEARPLLPSFLYLGAGEEAAAGTLDLPWSRGRSWAVGALARRQAAEVPDRTVAAAKSWLAYPAVDRRQPILPWEAPAEVARVSPVEAARRYLEHLAAAWGAAMPDAPLAEQVVVLTVPASFDASARELTREAALAAGLPDSLVLLEEPQAALYAWLADTGERWRRRVAVGDVILVCDVGGGTTDFTLIGVGEEAGELALRRLAVGSHTLVGGDNMDLALAHLVTGAFAERGVSLDAWQSVSLWHACRAAKEALLADDGPATHPVTVLGRGRRLVGGAVSVDLERKSAAALLLDGFFPPVGVGERPARRVAPGFRELGLPFEADTAITRHLAEFLTLHGEGGAPARPTRVLFNGGVFQAAALRERMLEVLGRWFPGAAPVALEAAPDLDHAVARGAAYYGAVTRGRGVRIRGGTARAYYVGIETAGPAVPGVPRPLAGLCVAPFGMEEGTEAEVPGAPIGLAVGEPARFRIFSSPVRKHDRPGDVLRRWAEGELTETDSMEATLPPAAGTEQRYVPVRFHARVTELGVFELWCVSQVSADRWKLEFDAREETPGA